MKPALFQTPLMRPERTGHESFEWAVKQCVEAEQAGFSEVWIGEHATQAWESIPNPELVIAAAALETESITFAPGAHLLPYHNPASLAIQVGFMTQILEGRYILGVGAGAYPNDGILRGMADLSENHAMVIEALDLMERVWRREPFHFEGKYFKGGFPEEDPSHPGADFSPYGGEVPIAVTGLSRQSPSIKFAGERGYIPCSVYSGKQVLRNHWETYANAAAENSREADRSKHHVVLDVLVAETDAEARRWAIEGGMGKAWEEYLLPVYKKFHLIDVLVEESGVTPDTIDLDFLAEHVWFVGSPETVTNKLNETFAETGGWGVLLVQGQDYADNPEPWRESMNLLATEVAPKVQAADSSLTGA